MDFYLRKNGTVVGPVPQADFLARLANGEYGATDEMSTDGRVWTRLGLTAYARSIQQGRVAASPRLPSVVPDLAGSSVSSSASPASASVGKSALPDPVSAPRQVPVYPGARNARPRRSPLRFILAVLFLAALAVAAHAVFRDRPPAGTSQEENDSQTTVAPPSSGTSSESSESPEEPASSGDDSTDGEEPSALLLGPLSDEDKAAAVASLPPLCQDAVAAYLFPDPADILDWFRVVRQSDYVLHNAEYRSKADGVWFRYHESSNEVNAVASAKDDATDGIHANLNILGGYVRFSRVVGAVMASEALAGSDAPSRLSLLTGPVALADDFSPEGAVAVLARCGIAPEWFLNAAFVQEAANLANGMGIATAAHEMGHIACGHIWRTARIRAETSRNKEREADSFAFSVSSEEAGYSLGAQSRYMFLGSVYELLAFSAQEAAGVQDLARRTGASTPDQLDALRARLMEMRTHPYSGARLLDLLRSQEDRARQYGLDPVAIEQSLRELGIH